MWGTITECFYWVGACYPFLSDSIIILVFVFRSILLLLETKRRYEDVVWLELYNLNKLQYFFYNDEFILILIQ